MGNVITGVAGFFLAAGYFRQFDFVLFGATIVGMTLVIASACTINNVLDFDIDAKMARTKQRAVVAGRVSRYAATVFGIALLLTGLGLLVFLTNWLVTIIGIAGYITYVWLYGALSKRLSIHGTLVGSISGAAPILAGYCAVSGSIDFAAILVFLALFFWQFPEFYSIAIYRSSEYQAAKIPVMPLIVGVKSTKLQILVYSILFALSAVLLTPLGYTGWIYLAFVSIVCAWLIVMAVKGLSAQNSDKWAKLMFHRSINVLMLYCLAISLGTLLP
jgi:protoheme IX farnesyltransferase